MSYWTHIRGLITVSPIGRTQAEKRFVLETVLNHLPIVSGSEGDMTVHIIQRSGYDTSVSCDEFGERTNNLIDLDGYKSRHGGMMRLQDNYFLVVEGDLRDCPFKEGLKTFNAWLCRLAKRVMVMEINVRITGNWFLLGHDNTYNITDAEPYYQMFEDPSGLVDDGQPISFNWCEQIIKRSFGFSKTMTEKEIQENLGFCKCGAVIQSSQWRMCPRCGTRFIDREEYDENEKNYEPKIRKGS